MAVTLASHCELVTKYYCRLSSRHFVTSLAGTFNSTKKRSEQHLRSSQFQLGSFTSGRRTQLGLFSYNSFSTMAPQPKYKLTYFPIKGLAEPIRFILTYARATFEDCRFEMADWTTKVKPNMPFGKVPVLEIDGKAIHQSVAISRYLGNKYGLGGKDDWENLQIDSLVDTMMDLRAQMAAMYFDQDKQSKALKKEPLKELVQFNLSKLDEILKTNGGFFVGKQMTWADLFWVGVLDYFGVMCGFRSGAELVEGYRHLKEHEEMVLAVPSIRTWVASRPKSAM